MFEFFVALYNLLPGHGYGLAIIILLVVVLVLIIVLIFEEMRLRKIIKDLETKLEALQKNYQPEEENLHKETPLQQAFRKLDAGVLPTIKESNEVDVPEESNSPKKVQNVQEEVYEASVVKKSVKQGGHTPDELSNDGVDVMSLVSQKNSPEHDVLEPINTEPSKESKENEAPGQNVGKEPVADISVKEDVSAIASGVAEDSAGDPVLRKIYAKRQPSVSSEDIKSVGASAIVSDAGESVPSALVSRKPYVKRQSLTDVNISAADIARKPFASRKSGASPKESSTEIPVTEMLATQHAMPDIPEKGRDSASRYEVKKDFMKIRDTTKTGIGQVHVMNRKEKRRLTDDLLPRAVTGNKIETKEIDKKIKVLEHDKFIARKFKEGKYERSRIQDNIDYLKGMEKNLFDK